MSNFRVKKITRVTNDGYEYDVYSLQRRRCGFWFEQSYHVEYEYAKAAYDRVKRNHKSDGKKEVVLGNDDKFDWEIVANAVLLGMFSLFCIGVVVMLAWMCYDKPSMSPLVIGMVSVCWAALYKLHKM